MSPVSQLAMPILPHCWATGSPHEGIIIQNWKQTQFLLYYAVHMQNGDV
jgi:hypothetical protein